MFAGGCCWAPALAATATAAPTVAAIVPLYTSNGDWQAANSKGLAPRPWFRYLAPVILLAFAFCELICSGLVDGHWDSTDPEPALAVTGGGAGTNSTGDACSACSRPLADCAARSVRLTHTATASTPVARRTGIAA